MYKRMTLILLDRDLVSYMRDSTDLDRSFVISMFWESLGKAMARNLSYNHSILFKVASFERCSILDYICMIYF